MARMKSRNLLALVVLATYACNNRRNTVPPEVAAARFVSDLGLKFQGKPNCTGADTDNDGYVTCTVALASGDGPPKMLSI